MKGVAVLYKYSIERRMKHSKNTTFSVLDCVEMEVGNQIQSSQSDHRFKNDDI